MIRGLLMRAVCDAAVEQAFDPPWHSTPDECSWQPDPAAVGQQLQHRYGLVSQALYSLRLVEPLKLSTIFGVRLASS